jgi:predicted Zn-dependent peptidase
MLSEFTKIADSGITADELELAYGNISGGLALKFESTQARMSRLAGTELGTGQFVDLDEALTRYREVTQAQVQELAAEILTREKTIVAVGDVTVDTFVGLI